MAITFSCGKCGRSLTTTDDKAGRQAKCPGCGELITVPGPESDAPASETESDLAAAEDQAAAPISQSVQNSNSCPMCGAENPLRARDCHACGEVLCSERKHAASGKPLEISPMLSDTWELFKENMAIPVVGVLCLSLPMVVWIYASIVSIITAIAYLDQQQEEALLAVSAVSGVIALVCLLVVAFIGPGYALVLLKIARGEAVTFGTLFSGGRYLIPNLLASAVYFVCLLFGFAACIVPGVLISLMWWAYQFVIVDEEASALSSLSRSKELMQGHWSDVFLLGLVGGLINYAVSSFCPVAGLFSQAYLGLLMAAAYVKLSGQLTAWERKLAKPEEGTVVDE